MTDSGPRSAPASRALASRVLASRVLAWAALAGVVAYVAIDVALFFLRPDLSLIHNAESDYGNGPYAWLMDLNFLIRFALSLAAAAAVWTATPLSGKGRAGALLLAVWAVGSGVLAFFPDDLAGAAPTAHGRIHLAAAGLAFLACLVGTAMLTVEFAGHDATRALVRPLSVLAGLGLVALLLLAHSGFRSHGYAGLFERVFLAAELAWIAVAAAWVARARVPAEPPSAEPPSAEPPGPAPPAASATA